MSIRLVLAWLQYTIERIDVGINVTILLPLIAFKRYILNKYFQFVQKLNLLVIEPYSSIRHSFNLIN